MKSITRAMLAAVAMGAVSIGGASAMPFNSLSPALGASDVQNVRVVCNQNGHCYNTVRTNRSARRYYAPRYYGAPQYYAAPQYEYYNAPFLGVGIGPFGFRVF
jgi:hypothetical protein